MKKITFVLIFLTVSFSTVNSQSLLGLIGQQIDSDIIGDYSNGIKWVTYFHGDVVLGATVFIDMADYMGITPEGNAGWVTVWFDATLGFGLPGGFGCIPRNFNLNAPDSPEYLFDIYGDIIVPGIRAVDIQISSNNFYPSIDLLTFNQDLEFSIGAGISLSVISIEIRKESLDQFINNILMPSLSIVQLSNSIINSFTNNGNWFNILNWPIRLTTPQDDLYSTLTQSVYYEDLIIGEWGYINVDVRVNETGEYYEKVWSYGGILQPNWEWHSTTDGPVIINQGETHTFSFLVKPTSESERFSYWLYQRDFLGLWKIIEKIKDPYYIYPLPAGTDLSQFLVTNIGYDDTTNGFSINFNKKLNGSSISENTIILSGSFSGNIPFSTSLSNDGLVLELTPETEFSPGESVELILTRYLRDIYDINLLENIEFSLSVNINPIVFQSFSLNKPAYNPSEMATLTVALENEITDASVSYSIQGGTTYPVNHVGSGVYQTSFAVPSAEGNYTLTVNASKEGYEPASGQATFEVVNAQAGHDMAVTFMYLDNTTYDFSDDVKVTARIENLGTIAQSNVPVFFRLIGPNGNTVHEIQETTSLGPAENTTIIKYLWPPSGSPNGTYTIEVRTNLSTDSDPSNDFKRQSVYIGDGPAYAQYYNSDWAIIEDLGGTSTSSGYTIKLIKLWTSYNGKPAAEVQVSKTGYQENAICFLNELAFFNNGLFVLHTMEVMVSAQEAWFNIYTPSNVMEVAPQKIYVDAGFSGMYNFDTPFPNSPSVSALFTEDAIIVDDWLSVVNFNYGNFNLKVTVPLAASRRLYNFWARTPAGYIQYLELQVKEPHNVQAISLTPENNSIFQAGETIEIIGTFKNIGGYEESGIPVKLNILGPDGYSYSETKSLNLSIGQQGTTSFSWNTTGSPTGQYTIKVEAIVSNDPYSNNSITNNLILEPGSVSLTASPNSLLFSEVPLFLCSQINLLISGYNLTNNIEVSAPEDFLITTDSSIEFSNFIIIPPGNGIVNQTIIVRFCPQENISYSGNIVISTPGTNDLVVPILGTVFAQLIPYFSFSPQSIDFGNVEIGDCSTASYLLGGEVFDAVFATAPSGFLISEYPDVGFQVGLMPVGVNNGMNIYVKFCPTAAVEYSGEIVHVTGYGPASVEGSVYVTGTGYEQAFPEVICLDYFSVCIDSDPFNLSENGLCQVNGTYPEEGSFSGDGVIFDGVSYYFDPIVGIGQYLISYCISDPVSGSFVCDDFVMEVLPLPVVNCPPNIEVSLNEPAFQLSGGSPSGGEYLLNGLNLGINPTFDPAMAGVGTHLITYHYPYYEYVSIPVIPPEPEQCTNLCEYVINVVADGSNIMKIHDATASINGTVTVCMEILNELDFAGFNLDIPIPEGFHYIEGSATLFRDNGHSLSFNMIAGNIARAISFAIPTALFSGNSGIILCFDLSTPSTPGTYPLNIQNAVISDAGGNNIMTGSIPGNITLLDTFTVTFDVKDGNASNVENAVIAINGVEYPAGQYIFNQMEVGSHNYLVSKDCYLESSGSFSITNGNVNENVILENLSGDVNNDGFVNVSDVIVAVNYYMGETPSSFCFNNSDVITDGLINVQDIIGIVNIFLGGKIHPYLSLESQTAHIFLDDSGIYLKSDGTLTGLQFEVTGSNLENLGMELSLPDHQIAYRKESGKITAMIFSTSNSPVPEGELKIVDFENPGTGLEWGELLGANLNAEVVPIVKHNNTTTGFEELHGISDLKVYPNPTNDVLWIKFFNHSAKEVGISLMNLNGQLIRSESIGEKGHIRTQLQLKELPSGIYFLKLIHDNDLVMERIVVN